MVLMVLGQYLGPHTDASHRDADELLPDHVSAGVVWTRVPPQDHHGGVHRHRVVAVVLPAPDDAALTQTPGPAEHGRKPVFIFIWAGRTHHNQTDPFVVLVSCSVGWILCVGVFCVTSQS